MPRLERYPSNHCGLLSSRLPQGRADLLITVKVHRTILVGRSAWFKKAFTGDFKVRRLSNDHVTPAATDRDQVVPEFGNLVLATLMTGSVSGAFTSNTVFQQWQDWCVTPPTRPPPQRERPALLGTPAPPVARGFGTVPPRVNNGFGTASPEVAGSGRGRGRRSGSGRGGGSGGGQWGFGSNWATPN